MGRYFSTLVRHKYKKKFISTDQGNSRPEPLVVVVRLDFFEDSAAESDVIAEVKVKSYACLLFALTEVGDATTFSTGTTSGTMKYSINAIKRYVQYFS
jgi:hypothetical protein